MRIAIIGYGKMGRAVHEVSREKGIIVSSIIDPTDPEATHRSIDEDSMKEVDVAIDFTSPKAVLGNIERVASLKKNIVVGTTGWYEELEKAKRIIEENEIGFIYSPNFSIGVNIFFYLIEQTAKLMDKADWYDIYILEGHHRQKVDSPSGTAKTIGEIILNNVKRKEKLLFETINRRIEKEELHVVSFRAGFITGLHIVGFDSEYDSIELKHEAKNRKGFALGAILAAEWIKDKKGFYSFRDLFRDIFLK